MLTIGEVASRAGLRASAIRYYEAEGLLPAAARQGGKRVYQESILERLAVIALAKAAGFELDEIRSLLSGPLSESPRSAWRTRTARKRMEIEEDARKLKRMREILGRLDGCGCATLEECGRAFAVARARSRNET